MKNQQEHFSTTESLLWRNTERGAYQLRETTIKNGKIWYTSVMVNLLKTTHTYGTLIVGDGKPESRYREVFPL